MLTRVVAVFAALVVLVSCTAAPPEVTAPPTPIASTTATASIPPPPTTGGTTVTTATDDRAQVLANYRAQLDAMTSHDTAALGRLLTDDFTLTHITGYVQARSEWLVEMAAGQFRYHAVDPQGEPQIQIAGDAATLTHRIVTDATVYGSRNRWRLSFVQTFVRRDGAWLASRSVATTW